MNKMEENTPEVLINFRRKMGRRNFIFLTSCIQNVLVFDLKPFCCTCPAIIDG